MPFDFARAGRDFQILASDQFEAPLSQAFPDRLLANRAHRHDVGRVDGPPIGVNPVWPDQSHRTSLPLARAGRKARSDQATITTR